MGNLKYFSMFSGIGGFELGIQRAFDMQPEAAQLQMETNISSDNGNSIQRTASCIGYSEIDKYAIKVYERHFNGQNSWLARERECDCSSSGGQETLHGERGSVSQINRDMHHDTNCSYTKSYTNGGHKNYGDATTINPEDLPDFDLLVGGFPCQAFSIAGKRKGFDDTRGTLFFDIARILAEKRPRHLVLENVKGLLSHDSGKTFQTILGVLSDLGYRVEWQVLNSKDFGVPQNRERIYFVGHLRGECSGEVFPIIAGTTANIKYDVRGSQRFRVYNPSGIAPTIPTMQGGNTEPKIFAQRGRYNKDGKTEQQLEPRPDGNTNTLTAVQKDNLVAVDLTRRAAGNHRVRKDGRAGTLDANYYKGLANQERPGVKEGLRIRRLTPKECERLQGFPDNWTEGESDTQRYKMCGNAVTVNVVEAVMKGLLNHVS